MRKADRHLMIRQIVTEQTVRTQEELLQLLEKQGVTATQATISRDIRDMMPEKVCSLAGFDTVAVISRTEEDAEAFFNFIETHAVL